MTARFSMNLDNHVERGHGSQLASWKVWLSSTRWQEGQLQEEGQSRRRQQQNSSHCVFCVIGSFGDLKWRSADLSSSLSCAHTQIVVMAMKNSARSCCKISEYNNIIARRGIVTMIVTVWRAFVVNQPTFTRKVVAFMVIWGVFTIFECFYGKERPYTVIAKGLQRMLP